MRIEYVNDTLQKFTRIGKRLIPGAVRPSVVVGYTANYAIYVHENLEAKHTNGQAKFLEAPARELDEEILRGIRDDCKKGLTLPQALLRAGLKLQRASQKLVPVDTGNLKGSAITRLEDEE